MEKAGEAEEEGEGEGGIDADAKAYGDHQEKQEDGEEGKPSVVADGGDDGYGIVGGDYLETKTTTPTSPAGGMVEEVDDEGAESEKVPDLPEESPQLVKEELQSSEAEQKEPADEMKPWQRRRKRKDEEKEKERIAATGSGSQVQKLEKPKEQESSEHEENEQNEDDDEEAGELGKKKESWSGVDMGNGEGSTKRKQIVIHGESNVFLKHQSFANEVQLLSVFGLMLRFVISGYVLLVSDGLAFDSLHVKNSY